MKRSEDRLRDRIGATVREIRTARGLSQKALAQLAGLSLPFIGALENGIRSCSVDTVERLARALGVEFLELVGPAKLIAHRNPDPIAPILALLRGQPLEKLELAERLLRELFRPTKPPPSPKRRGKPMRAHKQGHDRAI